jgi:phosphate transport system permease protein
MQLKSSEQFMDQTVVLKRMTRRQKLNTAWKWIFFIATLFGLIVLCVLLGRILSQGIGRISMDFLTSFPSRFPDQAGFLPAIIGSLFVMALTIPLSFILGVGTALYLEEYTKRGWFARLIQTNISNLAGVPSIVFGLLGLTLFVRFFGLGNSVLAGALTLSLLILPIIVVAAQEAIRAVPNELREASYAMGATKWQTIYRVVLPASMAGIITGSILSFSRAIGETAPLVMMGALTFVSYLPDSIFSGFTVMPIQIYNWTSRPQPEFQEVAAAGILVLLLVLFAMNFVAILIRNRYSKRY